MSCISVKITRVGEIGVSSELASEGIGVGIVREGAPVVRCSRLDTGITATLIHDAIQARLSMVCTPSIQAPYLEIEPEIIWVYPDWERTNDVFSNTTWNIN